MPERGISVGHRQGRRDRKIRPCASWDVSIADFASAGYDPGDAVAVQAGGVSYDMPFFKCCYADRGVMMVRAYPGHGFIAVRINCGKFAGTAGIGPGGEGSPDSPRHDRGSAGHPCHEAEI